MIPWWSLVAVMLYFGFGGFMVGIGLSKVAEHLVGYKMSPLVFWILSAVSIALWPFWLFSGYVMKRRALK